jgi:phosphate acyltransferase
MDEKPAQAMRRGAGSSMWNAVQAMKNVEAHAVVSAGNTGALMAISKLILRMVANIERPALIANWPTMRGHTAMLDVGANLQCDPDRLVQFAIMGAAFHHALNHSVRPTVGLLNVGSGVETGHQHVLAAHRLLQMAKLNFDYHGFVGGDDITTGIVDVVVTDGFTGNVALKTGEGAARLIRGALRRELNASPLVRFGAFLVRRALRIMVNRLDGGSSS